MGLINAIKGSINNVVGDQFKEFITCPIADKNTLMVRGIVQHGSANTNPTAGVISNGSKITVPQGWAMMIVDNGKVVEFSAEAGEYIYDNSSEPSIFAGSLGTSLLDSIKTIGSRITFGGQAARDQRVYYVNLLNITGNKFGSANSETILDPTYGSVEITFFGEYSFKVTDPVILVSNMLGTNAKEVVKVDDIISQLKLQFTSNVSTCISNLMVQNNYSFNVVQGHKNEVVAQMNDLLDNSWKQQYGIEVQDVALTINASDESKAIIREVDSEISKTKRMGDLYASNPNGLMAAASAEALKAAASNENGAMLGLAGMNMAGNAGANLMAAANAQTPAQPEMPATAAPAAASDAPAAGGAIPNFCPNCGAKTNGMNFCGNCGNKLS